MVTGERRPSAIKPSPRWSAGAAHRAACARSSIARQNCAADPLHVDRRPRTASRGWGSDDFRCRPGSGRAREEDFDVTVSPAFSNSLLALNTFAHRPYMFPEWTLDNSDPLAR